MSKPLLTTHQAADRLGVSVRTIHRMVERGDLAFAAKVPGQTGAYLFDPSAITAAKEVVLIPNFSRAKITTRAITAM